MRLRLQDFSEIVRTAVRSRDDPARLKQERSESQVELADLDSLRGFPLMEALLRLSKGNGVNIPQPGRGYCMAT